MSIGNASYREQPLAFGYWLAERQRNSLEALCFYGEMPQSDKAMSTFNYYQRVASICLITWLKVVRIEKKHLTEVNLFLATLKLVRWMTPQKQKPKSGAFLFKVCAMIFYSL